MELVPVGGRVKAAAVGLNHLFERRGDVIRLNNWLAALREDPFQELVKAFFPSGKVTTRRRMRGVGFYRPVLKTDQGMAGNFLAFSVDPSLPTTDLSVANICREEGVAIPEPYYTHTSEVTSAIQKAFSVFDFSEVNGILRQIASTRKATKGRTPFFLIRSAITDRPIVFGHDIIKMVAEVVNQCLDRITEKARQEERAYCGSSRDGNLLYCQPDVFVLSDGTVAVEKINCPDVGLFLCGVYNPFASILPSIQKIVLELKEAVCRVIASNVNSEEMAFVTRDEVLSGQQDLLEIKEIECLREGLGGLGIEIKVYPVSQVNEIPDGQKVLLLNIDYGAPGIEDLLARHCRGELVFYPNPFLQRTCQRTSGLEEAVVPSRHLEQFLQLIGSIPKDSEALSQVLQRIDGLLSKNGIFFDIIHADIGHEAVPVFRPSLRSWRVLKQRISRYNGRVIIKLQAIPVVPERLLINSETGPRLHTFRFMFVKS